MNQADFHLPARLVTGLDSSFRLGDITASIGTRAVLLLEEGLHENPQTQILLDSLKRVSINHITFEGLRSGSSVETIHTILEKSRVAKPQVFIAVGSIRTLSLARLLGALTNSKISIERFIAGEKVKEAPVPVIDVPSTGLDPFAGAPYIFFCERFVATPIFIPQERNPVTAILFDPKIPQSLSKKEISYQIFENLLLLVEILFSTHRSQFTNPFAQAGIDEGVKAIRQIVTHNHDAKAVQTLCESGAFTTMSLASGSIGPVYAIVAAINARFGISKSWVSAILLPYTVEWYGPTNASVFKTFVSALGEDSDNLSPDEFSHKIAGTLRRFIAKLDLPPRLRDLKLTLDNLQEAATIADTLSISRLGPIATNPQLTMDFLRKAF